MLISIPVASEIITRTGNLETGLFFSKKIEADYENYEQRANEEIQKISEELVGKKEIVEENIEEEILEKPVEEKQEESFVYDFDD